MSKRHGGIMSEGTAVMVDVVAGKVTISFEVEAHDEKATIQQLRQIASDFREHVEERAKTRTMRTGIPAAADINIYHVGLEFIE